MASNPQGLPPLPAGFRLMNEPQQGGIPPLPPGFRVLDQPAATNPIPTEAEVEHADQESQSDYHPEPLKIIYGKDEKNQLVSTWNGSEWEDLYTGKKAPAPHSTEGGVPEGPLVPFLSSPEFQKREQQIQRRQTAIQAATHQPPPQIGYMPIEPEAKQPLVPAAPSTDVTTILPEEPDKGPRPPLGPLVVAAGQARNIKAPQVTEPYKPEPGSAEEAATDLRDLLLGPAYGAKLKSDSTVESVINAMLRSSASFNTPEGVATMWAGIGLGKALPALVQSPRFVTALFDHPELSKAVDILANNAPGIGMAAYGIPVGGAGVVKGIANRNPEQIAQGAITMGIGAAGLGMAARNAAQILDLYPGAELPPGEIPARQGGPLRSAVLEAARPEGVEPTTTAPNPELVPQMIEAQKNAQALDAAGAPLSAQQWLRRAEEIKGALPTQQITIGADDFTIRQSGVSKSNRPIYELLDPEGKRVAGGYAGTIRSEVQRRADLATPRQQPEEVQEAIDQAGAFQGVVEEMAERYRDILSMQRALDSGEDVQMGGRTMEATTPEARRQMLADNIQAHQQIYDAAWESVAKDLGPEAATQLRQHIESYGHAAPTGTETATTAPEATAVAAPQGQPVPGAIESNAPQAETALPEIAAGAQFTTESGTFTVTKIAGNRVLFRFQEPGKKAVTPKPLPLEDFRALISPEPAAAQTETAPPMPPGFRPLPPQEPPVSTSTEPAENPPASAAPSLLPGPSSPGTPVPQAEGAMPAETATPANETPTPATEKPQYDFASTQANLSGPVADAVRAAAGRIPDEHLASAAGAAYGGATSDK